MKPATLQRKTVTSALLCSLHSDAANGPCYFVVWFHALRFAELSFLQNEEQGGPA